ncbi:MAG: DUF2141 domain-containing protein [Deltaproteobacteria bacterium]|nr:DUF2141 domain-containing protein [Deltaproteobacteria bacterium]
MKKLIMVGVLFITPLILTAAEVSFVIKNLKNDEGSIRIAIYNSAESFLKPGKTVSTCSGKIPLNKKEARVVCELKSGTYVAAVFHDENGNGQLDTNFIKLPQEGYGFSNNAKGSLGPPEYEDATFSVAGDMEYEITLIY